MVAIAAPIAASAGLSAAAGGSGFLSSLGSLGSLLGGIGGMFGGSKGVSKADARDMMIDQRKEAINNALKLPKAIVKGWQDAGVHPLYALGAGGAQPMMPQTIGTMPAERDFASAGQNIGSALYRMASPNERRFAEITAAQAIDRGELENELLKTQIAQIRASMVPPFSVGNGHELIPDQANSTAGVKIVPKEDTLNFSGEQPGLRSGLQWFELPGIGKVRMPSNEFAEAGEDSLFTLPGVALGYTLPDVIRSLGGKISRSKIAKILRSVGRRS